MEQFANAEDIKKRYQEGLDEIERRRTVAKAPSETQMMENASTKNIFEDMDNQQVFLITKVHRFLRPMSDRPGFAILGGFSNAEQLRRRAMANKGAYNDYSLYAVERGKYFLVPTSMEKEQNSEYILKKLETIQTLHNKDLQVHNDDFQKNYADQKQGKQNLSTARKKNAARDKAIRKTQERRGGGSLTEVDSTFGTGAEIRSQQFAVISVRSDITEPVLAGKEDPEPAIAIWAVFRTEEEAIAWTKSSASLYIRDVTMDVVAMYEILWPEDINPDKLKESYRNEELNKIMNQKKIQEERKNEFEVDMKMRNKPIKDIVVTDQSDPTVVKGLPTDLIDIRVDTVDAKTRASELSSNSS